MRELAVAVVGAAVASQPDADSSVLNVAVLVVLAVAVAWLVAGLFGQNVAATHLEQAGDAVVDFAPADTGVLDSAGLAAVESGEDIVVGIALHSYSGYKRLDRYWKSEVGEMLRSHWIEDSHEGNMNLTAWEYHSCQDR